MHRVAGLAQQILGGSEARCVDRGARLENRRARDADPFGASCVAKLRGDHVDVTRVNRVQGPCGRNGGCRVLVTESRMAARAVSR